jgi:hypothetical protein
MQRRVLVVEDLERRCSFVQKALVGAPLEAVREEDHERDDEKISPGPGNLANPPYADGEHREPEAVRQAAEQLLQDKPMLTATASALPGKTASARLPEPTLAARVRQAASRAAQTGSRRAVGEYLRLRRQSQVPA